MSKALQEAKTPDLPSTEVLAQVMTKGDLKALNNEQLAEYNLSVCKSLGLNPLTNPFEYINLNGKVKLYAKRDATDQLRKVYGVSVEIVNKQQIGDLFTVDVKATDKHGRSDVDTGAVVIGHLRGEALANAMMKAITKAKRRVTLSLCGLGMLDESETDTIPNAKPYQPTQEAKTEQKELEAEIIDEPKLTKGQTIANFKQKAISFGLNPTILKSFAEARGLTNNDEGIAKMNEYLSNEEQLKQDIREFLTFKG